MFKTFKDAAMYVQMTPASTNPKITQEVKLLMYGLYKQATQGINPNPRPGGFLQFQAKAKWDAWEKHRSKTKEEAQKEYLDLVNHLVN